MRMASVILSCMLALCGSAADTAVKKYVSSTNKVDGLPSVYLGRVQMADGSAVRTLAMMKDPEYVPSFPKSGSGNIAGKHVVFANGRPIIVLPTPNRPGYTRIQWYIYAPDQVRPYLDIPDTPDLVIFGGSDGSDSENVNIANTSVTVDGANVAVVFGGNFGNGTVGNAVININKGSSVRTVYGGSHGQTYVSAAGINQNGFNDTFLTNQFSQAQRSFVGRTTININLTDEDTPMHAVYGGGYSCSDVGYVEVNIYGGRISAASGSPNYDMTSLARAMVCAGSSSGTVGTSVLNVFGGYLDSVQAWSRGYTGGSTIRLYDGVVARMFAGGDTATGGSASQVSTASGGWVSLDLQGGTVTNLLSGFNCGVVSTDCVSGFYSDDVILHGNDGEFDPAEFHLKLSGSMDKSALLGRDAMGDLYNDGELPAKGFVAYADYETNMWGRVCRVADVDGIMSMKAGFSNIVEGTGMNLHDALYKERDFILLKSPNSTVYRLTVDNSGNVTAVQQ